MARSCAVTFLTIAWIFHLHSVAFGMEPLWIHSRSAEFSARDQAHEIFLGENNHATIVSNSSAPAAEDEIQIDRFDDQQNLVWSHSLHIPDLQLNYRSSSVNDRGEVFVAFYSAEIKWYDHAPFLVKISAEGQELWRKSLNIEFRNMVVASHPEGGVIVSGKNFKTSHTVLFDADGEEQWRHLFKSDLGEREEYDPEAILINSNGDIFITGEFGYDDDCEEDCPTEICTLKYNSDGELQWDHYYEGLGLGYQRPAGMQFDSEENLLIYGRMGPARKDEDYLVYKLDSDANLDWDFKAGYTEGLLKGLSLSSSGKITITGNLGTIQLDSQGEELWRVELDPEDPLRFQGLDIESDGADGAVIIAGVEGELWEPGSLFVLEHRDSSGELSWRIERSGDQRDVDHAWRIVRDSNEQFHVLGQITNFGSASDLAYLITDSAGEVHFERVIDNKVIAFYQIADAIKFHSRGGLIASGVSGGDFAAVRLDPSDGSLVWAWEEGQGNWLDTQSQLLEIKSDGRAVLSGALKSDFKTVVLDLDGVLLWERIFDNGRADFPKDMVLNSDDEIIVCGASQQKGHPWDHGISTLMYSPNGEERFNQRIDPSNRHEYYGVIGLDRVDNLYVVSGTSWYGSGTSPTQHLTKYSSNGDWQWEIPFSRSEDFKDRPQDLTILENGDIVIASESEMPDFIGWTLLRYDSNGNLKHFFHPPSFSAGEALVKRIHSNSNNDMWLTGNIQPYRDPHLSDAAVIKMNFEGEELWSYIHGGDGRQAIQGSALALDGTLYVAGSKVNEEGSEVWMVLAIDQDGNLLWEDTQGGVTSSISEAKAITFDHLGNVYVSGTLNGEFAVMKYRGTSSDLPLFLRGDCDGDGKVRSVIQEAIFNLRYNFVGGSTPPCFAACDFNANGTVDGDLSDAVYLLTFGFLGGPSPQAPWPNCDLSGQQGDIELGCEQSPLCN